MLTRRRPEPQRWPPPRAGRWFAEPRPLRRTQRPVPGWWQPFVCGPVALFLVCREFGFPFPKWGFWIFLSGLLLWFVLVVEWQIGETLALRKTPGDRALSDAPPGLTEFPVEIVFYDAHGTYGMDRGFVWFEDGLMTFNGTACSFVVAAGDLYSRREPNGKNLHHRMPGSAVRFRVPGKTFYATICPLSGLRGLSFDYHLGRFLASVASGERPRQWPPTISYAMQDASTTPTMDSAEAVGGEAARTGSGFGVLRRRP